MAVKLVALMRKSKSLSRSEFRAHYESVHAPLIWKTMPGIKSYRRNYFQETVSGFDVITEIHFLNMDDFGKAMAASADEAAWAPVSADEEFLFDREVHQIHLVDVAE